MKYKSFSAIACVLLLSAIVACSNGGNAQTACDRVWSGNRYILKMDRPYYVDKFSNLFSEVRYVPLEETRNSIVGTVSKMEITKEGDIIVFDSKAGGVFRFASDGKFLNNIGFRGHGGNEYVLPDDMKYDPFCDKVLVWDNGKSAILTYGMDGEMESKIQLPWIIASFGILDKNRIICYMNNGEDIHGSEKGTNYKIVRRDGTIEREFGEYGKEMTYFTPPAQDVFIFQQGRSLCVPPYSYTLFSVEGDSLNAIASFDLQESTIPQEWLCGSSIDLDKRVRQYPNLVEVSSVYETDRYYILRLVRDRIVYLCQVQKDTKAVRSISANLINDMYGMVGNTNVVHVHGDKLYFSVDPMNFEAKGSFLRAVPEGVSLKDAVWKQREHTLSAIARTFAPEGAVTYADTLKTVNFGLSPGEREFIDVMSRKSNPILQICTLK